MKNVLIVGATSSIAVACAREWAAAGARLFLAARDAGRLIQVAADLRARGGEVAEAFVLDANDSAAHPAMFEACARTLGTIDVALIAHGTLPDQSACERDAMLAVKEFTNNAVSTIALLTRLANLFDSQRHGTIAVISSVAAERGRPSNYLYGSAKAAVSTFCEGLRARMARVGVHVIDIRPGFVATPMTASLRLPPALVASPEAVASRIVAGIESNVDVLYAPFFWRWIMLAIRWIPGFVFNRIRL